MVKCFLNECSNIVERIGAKLCYQSFMDWMTAGYYAVVCGILASVVPPGIRLIVRFVVGACVGIVAAGVLPMVQSVVSY